MGKRILLASAAFYPEISPRSFRATELAKEFSRQGHYVKVITLDRGTTQHEFCRQHGIQLKVLTPRTFPTWDAGGMGSLPKRILRRLLLQLAEYPDIELYFKYAQALKQESGYDLLISFAVPYPVHWGVARARSARHKIARVWVADCGDPYMGNTVDSFRKMFHFKFVEKWFCAKADFLAITHLDMRDHYYPEFHDKIKEIPQGFNFESDQKNLPLYQPHPVPTFAYAGTFIPGLRDPRPLLNYLNSLSTSFRLFLFTTTPELVKPWVESSRGRMELRPVIPREELLPQLAAMDFLLNISYDIKVQSPSKLVDYYLVNRPVLSLQSGQVDIELVGKFLAGDYSGQFRFEHYDRFRIEAVARQFISLIPA